MGAPVVEAITQPGGFSPGVAARLRGADDSRAFVKAVSADTNPDSPGLHRREARISASLPEHAPAPRLLASYDDGTWVALLLEDIEGRHPRLPWETDELRRVIDALDVLSAELTPCPLADAAPVGDRWRDEFHNWRSAAVHPPPALDHWSLRHLDELAALEAEWEDAASGNSLLHLDVRADNVLIAADRVWFVDWPWAARGNPAFDVVGFAPSVAMQGGADPEELLRMSRTGRAADPDVVTVLVATIAGYFTVNSLRPPSPGLPTVREFQAAQGAVALAWLRQRTGWGC